MHYKKLKVNTYKGIQEPIEFDLEKERIFPLIGINECGKTTLLNAILAFDHASDRQNGGRHLEDTSNLYSVKPSAPTVSAEVKITADELIAVLEDLKQEQGQRFPQVLVLRLARDLAPERGPEDDRYTVDELVSGFSEWADRFLKETDDKSSDLAVSIKKARAAQKEFSKLANLIASVSDTYSSNVLTITRALGKDSGRQYSLGSPFDSLGTICSTLMTSATKFQTGLR